MSAASADAAAGSEEDEAAGSPTPSSPAAPASPAPGEDALDGGAVRWLARALASLGAEQPRAFLSFVPGSPRVPARGLRGLSPPLTGGRARAAGGKGGKGGDDALLPSASTCTNYLKLPDYSSEAVLRARLATALSEGPGSFHLS